MKRLSTKAHWIRLAAMLTGSTFILTDCGTLSKQAIGNGVISSSNALLSAYLQAAIQAAQQVASQTSGTSTTGSTTTNGSSTTNGSTSTSSSSNGAP